MLFLYFYSFCFLLMHCLICLCREAPKLITRETFYPITISSKCSIKIVNCRFFEEANTNTIQIFFILIGASLICFPWHLVSICVLAVVISSPLYKHNQSISEQCASPLKIHLIMLQKKTRKKIEYILVLQHTSSQIIFSSMLWYSLFLCMQGLWMQF